MIERRESVVFIIMIVFWLNNLPFGLEKQKRKKERKKKTLKQ
jgi:hypothetical protein